MLETASKLLLSGTADGADLRTVDPETQARLEALLEAAGMAGAFDSLIVMSSLLSIHISCYYHKYVLLYFFGGGRVKKKTKT